MLLTLPSMSMGNCDVINTGLTLSPDSNPFTGFRLWKQGRGGERGGEGGRGGEWKEEGRGEGRGGDGENMEGSVGSSHLKLAVVHGAFSSLCGRR